MMADEVCAADDLASACARFCDAFCASQEAFCIDSRCPPGECAEGGDSFDTCMSSCDGKGAECWCRLGLP